MDNIQELIIVSDDEGIILHCSESLCQLLGQNQQDIIGNHESEYIRSENGVNFFLQINKNEQEKVNIKSKNILPNKKNSPKISHLYLSNKTKTNPLSSLFQQAPLGFVLTELNGEIIQANNKLENLLGYESKQLKGASLKKLTPDYFNKKCKHLYEELLQKGTLAPHRKELETKERKYIPVEVSGFLVKDEGKDRIWSIIEDLSISEKKEKVFDSIKRVRQWYLDMVNKPGELFDQILSEVVDISDCEYAFIAEAPQGTTHSTFDGRPKNINDLISCVKETRSTVFAGMDQDFQINGETVNNITAIPMTDNENITAVLCIINVNNDFLKETIQILKPLSDHISDIYTLVNASHREKEAKLKLEIISNASELGVWDWDLVTNKVSIDSKWSKILGLQSEHYELDGDDYDKLLHPEDIENVKRQRRNYLSGKSSVYEIRFRMKNKLGTWIPVLAKGKVIERNEKRQATRFSGTLFDLTHISEIEKQLEEQKKISQHHSKLASIGELASGVGHEINNPLTIVYGNLDRLERELESLGVSSKTLEISIAKSIKALDRISNIVNGLRKFAREDSDLKENVCISRVIEETLSLIQEMFSKDGVNINVNLPKTPVYFYGSSSSLQQSLTNLLTNAKDAMKNCETKKIDITLKVVNGGALIIVSDTGSGIPKELHSKVFDTFFTTKDVGEGTGLGLAITHKLLDSMGGAITFQSQKNKGTEFHIHLPSVCPFNDRFSFISKQTYDIPNLENKKIMVCEYDAEKRKIIYELVTPTKAEVIESANLDVAVKKISSEKIDILITDSKSENTQGTKLVDWVRSNTNIDQPKIFIVARNLEEVQNNEELSKWAHTITGYFYKPLHANSFYKTISLASWNTKTKKAS